MICQNIHVFLLRYGLDEAILGSTSTEDPEADVGRIARLLKHGAHSLVGAEENQQGEAFQSEDIDQVGGRGAGVDHLVWIFKAVTPLKDFICGGAKPCQFMIERFVIHGLASWLSVSSDKLQLQRQTFRAV